MQNDNDLLEIMRQHHLKTSPYNKMASDSDFTACVGANGHYGQDTICDGFRDAVQILISSLKSGSGTADSLIYPILFCARHTFELYLKDIYNSIQFIYGAKTHKNAFVKLQKLYRIRSKISQRVEICKCQLNQYYSGLSTPIDETSTPKYIGTLDKHLEMIDIEIKRLHGQCFIKAEMDLYTHDLSDLKNRILSIYWIDTRIKNVFDPVLQ